jgi:transcriptional regulator with XRE-family HTH domain
MLQIDFREIVNDSRLKRGMSVNRLANRAGVNQPNVQRYLSGKTQIRASDLARLFEVLGLTTSTESLSDQQLQINSKKKDPDD